MHIAQITDFIPRYIVDKAVAKYKGDFHAKDLSVIINYSTCFSDN